MRVSCPHASLTGESMVLGVKIGWVLLKKNGKSGYGRRDVEVGEGSVAKERLRQMTLSC